MFDMSNYNKFDHVNVLMLMI